MGGNHQMDKKKKKVLILKMKLYISLLMLLQKAEVTTVATTV